MACYAPTFRQCLAAIISLSYMPTKSTFYFLATIKWWQNGSIETRLMVYENELQEYFLGSITERHVQHYKK